MITLLQLAAAPEVTTATRARWFLPLVIGSALLVLAGLGLGLWWLLVYRKRRPGTPPPARGIDRKRLVTIWEKFLASLPGAARAAIPSHSHFLVMGAAGAGKSTLIQRKVDWQGQASQFLPSYTADPLLQIYLGGKTVVQELAAPLLDSTSRATNDALTRLFGKLDIDQPPTVVLVLKVSSLTTASPDQIRQQAQLMRGKINLLSQSFGVPIPTRICLSNLDRTQGYSEVARFLKRIKVPLELPLGADGGLVASLQSYEKHLPRALTTLPVGAFQSNVEFLLAAEDVLGPVRSFIQALLEGSLAAVRPELQRLYFFSPSPDEQVGNPFDIPPRQGEVRKVAWLRRWLHQIGVRPLHAALGALVLVAGLGALTVITRRHAALVQTASDAATAFDGAVRRSQEARSAPSESEAVRSAERESSRSLTAVNEAERRFRPLAFLFRDDKAATRQRFVESVRAGYLLPELERSVRMRSRERILYALVAVYATRHNTLGAILRAHPGEWSSTMGVSSEILLDYVRENDEPWRELALRLLPPLPSEASRWPVNDLRPWREHVHAIARALPLPYLPSAQLKELQLDAEKLLDTLAQVRKAGTLRQIFRALSEESPLDMVRLFGRDAGALSPHPFLVDNAEPLEKLLVLVRDSSLQLQGGGRMSLFRLLKWINELGASADRSILKNQKGEDGKLEDEIYHLPFPDEKPSEISRRAWLDLLLRSRKRLLLAYQIGHTSGLDAPHARSRHHKDSGCEIKKKRRRPRATSCPVPAGAEGEEVESLKTSSSEHRRHRRESELPLWSREEFRPKLAALMNGDDVPSDGLGELYNRPVFEKEVLPLIQELKRALATSRSLTPDEKLRLSRLVLDEVGGYAHRYCAELRRYYLSYRFHARSNESLHSELLNLVNPGSPFLAHLRSVADNVLLSGLDEPYLRSLSQCLAELQPVAAVVYPEAARSELGATPNAKEEKTAAKTEDKPGDKAAAGPPRRTPGGGVPEGLRPYKDAVYKLVSDLDGVAPATGDKPSPLAERLGPLGKGALLALEGRSDTALQKAEKFLDDAGISGELRRPFLSPFQAAYRSGFEDIERALASHWRDELLPVVAPLFTRFPFNRAAEREVAPSELDVLSESRGAFFQDLRSFYAPVLTERGGDYQQKLPAPYRIELPADLLTTVNRLARLSRALFRTDGSRQPLRLAIRGQPGRTVREERTTQATTAFLQVGKAAAYGFNQQPTAIPLSVDWWDQGVAVVGMESTTSTTGRRQTQSMEVADSAWSLFRLLQKSTLESDGASTWRLLGDGLAEPQALRFVIQPDPWNLFQVRLP